MKRAILLFLAFALAGCSAAVPTAVSPELTDEAASATATVALTPTQTLQPTDTPEPTPTPTPELPVGALTPVPAGSQPLDAGNAAQLRLLAVSQGDPNGVTAVSSDGTRAVFSSSEGTEILDLANQALLGKLDAAVAFNRFGFTKGWLSLSEDGSVVGLVAPDAVKILAADGTLLYSMENRLNEDYPSLVIMDGVGVSPDGKLAAISECAAGEYDGCPFQVVDTQKGEAVYTWNNKMLELHGSAPLFSPDGSLLATWHDGSLWFWSTSDWSSVADIPADEMQPWVFSTDGKQMILGGQSIQVWDIAGREMLQEFMPADGNYLYGVTMSSDGALVGGADNVGHGYVGKVSEGGELEAVALAEADPARIRFIGGELQYASLPGHDLDLWTSGQADDDFRFVATEDSAEIEMLSNRQGRLCGASLSGAALCSGADYAALTPSGAYVFAVDNAGVIEVRATTDPQGELLASLPWSGYQFILNGFDPQNHLLFYTIYTGVNSSAGYIYDTEKAAVVKKFDSGRLAGAQFSSDGKYAAIAVNHNPRLEVIVFDLAEKTIAYQNTFQYGMDNSLVFTPDGQKIAVLAGSNSEPIHTVQLIDLAAPHAITAVPFELSEERSIRSMAISPDGALVAAGLDNGQVILAQTADGTVVHEFQACTEWVDRLAFSPDSTLLAVYSVSGYLKIYGIVD